MMGQATYLVSIEGLQPSFNNYPKALYVKCVSYALNLCVVAACSIQAIRKMYGAVEEICLFFNYSQNSNKSYKSILKIYQLGP